MALPCPEAAKFKSYSQQVPTSSCVGVQAHTESNKNPHSCLSMYVRMYVLLSTAAKIHSRNQLLVTSSGAKNNVPTLHTW